MFLVIMATSIGSSASAWQFPKRNSCNEFYGYKWSVGKCERETRYLVPPTRTTTAKHLLYQ
jgi:hypothetical protein